MQVNGKNGFALLLIGCGALILLSKFGFGHLFSFLIPIGIFLLGYVGLRNGKKILGTTLMVIGVVLLLGKLTTLIGFIIAIAMIVYGFSMMKKNKKVYEIE